MPSRIISTARIINPKLLACRLAEAIEMRFTPPDRHVAALTYITGISAPQAAAWLAGDVLPSIKNLLRICHFYRINPTWLLTGDGHSLVDEDFLLLHAAWAHADEREREILRSIARTILTRYPPPPAAADP